MMLQELQKGNDACRVCLYGTGFQVQGAYRQGLQALNAPVYAHYEPAPA
jgi:hypothetical protein